MEKNNDYPKELKIQIVERILAGESATALQKEFHIPSNGIIYTWKKWFISHDLKRIGSVSGRPQITKQTLEQELENKNKELALLKNFSLRKDGDSRKHYLFA
ncbi:helix-turn-helix domain-containing protein [Enterococcus hirae]|uniref:helix-turn-helix domain-containing protein n=1 Tax=Enterococcus hirae TaxID=1354 RepID=UPI0010AC710D|nr:helix-turn-helix domain-containing protein [Enterococcus hirae]EMF0071072.1 transposase [Enterococcus hirae]EMF0228900.1 transposase [Enterococcus hirae]TJY26951.1 transposase [Enterococcus hirae]